MAENWKRKYHFFVEDFSEGLADVYLNGKYGFVDTKGNEVIPPKYDHVDDFSESLARVELNGKEGFVDKTGKEVIPLKYDSAWAPGYFSRGIVRGELNKEGFVEKTGKEVIPWKYLSVNGFSEGLAAVQLNGKWGFVDKTGKEVIPLKYDSVYGFSEGLAEVGLYDDETRKCGYIDKDGKEYWDMTAAEARRQMENR